MTLAEVEKWIGTYVLNFHTSENATQYKIDRVIYWRLSQVTCHRIDADTAWFKRIVPQLAQFWQYVQYYRTHRRKLDGIVKLAEEIGVAESAVIFKQVNKDYARAHTKAKYKPLYQTPSEWRIKYDGKNTNVVVL